MKHHILMQSTVTATVLVVALLRGPSALGADLNVPTQYPTIQVAVDAAGPGDTIRIEPGVYSEQVLILRKKLTLIGVPGAILRATPGMTATLKTTGLPPVCRPTASIVSSGCRSRRCVGRIRHLPQGRCHRDPNCPKEFGKPRPSVGVKSQLFSV